MQSLDETSIKLDIGYNPGLKKAQAIMDGLRPGAVHALNIFESDVSTSRNSLYEGKIDLHGKN